jgi:hypothetical protein
MKNILLIALIFSVLSAYGQNPKRKVAPRKVAVAKKAPVVGVAKRRAPASDPDAPIEVRGQSRNLNMMLILQNQDEIIDFIKLRKDYQTETQKMNY